MKYKYDQEADVLAITLAQKPFVEAEEIGNFIVHYDKAHVPVYVEILNAHRFLHDANKTIQDARNV